MATSRTTLRRMVGDRSGDAVVLKATHVSSTADTFRDVVNMGDRGDDAPSVVNKIAYLMLAARPTLGYEARISSYASTDRIITFDPDAGSIPQVDDELELWSVTERVGSIETLHRLLNAGIKAVEDIAGTETWDTAQTFRARSPQLTIPPTWAEFGGADWVDTRGNLHEIPPDRLRVRPGTRQVEILHQTSWRANGRGVQLWGYPRLSAMTADSGANGETDVDAEWLVETTLAAMSIRAVTGASEMRSPSQERMGTFWDAKATQFRRDVARPRRGLGIWLP